MNLHSTSKPRWNKRTLVVNSPDTHKLVHAKDNKNISKLLETSELSNQQHKKLKQLRGLVGNESILNK